MRPEEIEDLLGAYALDAVDPDEREVVEQYLATHPRERAELAQHQEVATLLAYSGTAAPAGLWNRIAASLEERAPEPGPELAKVLPMAHPPRPRRPQSAAWLRPGRVAAAVAAVAAAIILPLAIGFQRQDRQITALRRPPLEQGFEAARADPAARTVRLVSGDGAVTVTGVVATDGTGFLQADPLPPLPADKTYQLWAVQDDGTVSLGLLGSDPAVTVFHTDAGRATLAITAERRGGVVASDQPAVAAGELA